MVVVRRSGRIWMGWDGMEKSGRQARQAGRRAGSREGGREMEAWKAGDGGRRGWPEDTDSQTQSKARRTTLAGKRRRRRVPGKAKIPVMQSRHRYQPCRRSPRRYLPVDLGASIRPLWAPADVPPQPAQAAAVPVLFRAVTKTNHTTAKSAAKSAAKPTPKADRLGRSY